MKKTSKVLAILMTAVLTVSSLTGCGTSGGRPTSTGETSGQGAIVSFPMTTDPDNLDASRADDMQKNQIVLEVQETLVRFDENGELQMAGAESYKTSEDGLTWTFKLRDNKYSDGTEVKAADYANGLLRVLDPEVGSHDAGTWYIVKNGEAYNNGKVGREEVGVKAVDDKTLEITLEQPIPYFLQMVNSSKVTPIPESHTQGSDNTTYGTDATKMVYSGPFQIAEWTRGSKVVLTKNPNYWDAVSVQLDTINMPLVQEENTKQQMFEQGELDILTEINSEYYEKLKDKIDSGEVTLVENSKPSNSYICFNNQDPNGIFTNAKIRKAFSLAIDRETYIDKVYKKDAPAYGIIPPATNNGDTIFRDVVEEPLQPTEDPKALLEEGLKEIGKEGENIEVTFLQGNSDNATKVKSEYFQNQWETKLGVKVKIDTASDSATFNQQVSKGDYQVCSTGWGADYNDPMTFMQLYVTGDGNNAPFFSNEKYDELVTSCISESNMAVRQEKFKEAEKIVVEEEAAVAPLTYGLAKNVMNNKVKGISFNGAGGPTVEFKTASVE